MTLEEAKKLCGFLNPLCTKETGYGKTSNDSLARDLRLSFPEFNWRVILTRHNERSSWALTIDDADIREHYVPVGGVCIHCGKTAVELGVEEQDDDE